MVTRRRFLQGAAALSLLGSRLEPLAAFAAACGTAYLPDIARIDCFSEPIVASTALGS